MTDDLDPCDDATALGYMIDRVTCALPCPAEGPCCLGCALAYSEPDDDDGERVAMLPEVEEER